MQTRTLLFTASGALLAIGWTCAAVGVRNVVTVGNGDEGVISASGGTTMLGSAGVWLMAISVMLLAATAISSRRSTLVGLGLLATVRVFVLATDALQARGNSIQASPTPSVPQFFQAHTSFLGVTSILIVVLTLVVALQIRGSADVIAQGLLLAAAAGYATASFFGPAQWVWSPPGPDVDRLGDAAGYLWLLVAEILLAAMLLGAVSRHLRRHRALQPT